MKTELERIENISFEKKDGKLHYAGCLDLEGTGITSLPDNLTVGGSLYLRGTGITDTTKVNKIAPSFYEWRNRRYIKADGIFSEVVRRRGNVLIIRQIGATKETYLVTDGNNKWAHGDNLKKAKNDLIYKVSNRDKSEYDGLTPDSEVSLEEAIEMFRVITGACAFGTKDFVENRLTKKKSAYRISEIITLTKGEYGNSAFERFFI